MRNKVSISVLITAYNHEEYITDAINSILKSNFNDYEIIIVDDHSSDNTYQLALDFSKKYSHILVYRNDTNIGDYPNRNIAASYATGRYLKYLDSDDLIYPFSLDIFYKSLQENPSCALAFTSNKIQINNSSFPIIHKPMDSFRSHFLEGGLFYAGPGGMLIRKDVFDKIGGFGTKRHISDTDFLMQVALHHNILEINPGLIWWRIHPNQESAKESINSLILAQRFKSAIHFIGVSPLSTFEKRKAISFQYKVLSRKILKSLFFKLKLHSSINLYKASGIRFFHLLWAFHIRINRT